MQGKRTQFHILLAFGLLVLTMLACGGFQIRATPTETPVVAPTVQAAVAAVETSPAPAAAEPAVPDPLPTEPPPAPAQDPTIMALGNNVRVTASGGLNMRDEPGGEKVGRLDPGMVVSLTDGPVEVEDFAWWQVDSGTGLVGWVAAGRPDDPWLVPDAGVGPAAGGGKLVDRPIRLGDRVQVTTGDGKLLTIREDPGLTATEIARAVPDTQFIVRGGPIGLDSLSWWQLEGADYTGWAAQGTEDDRWLTPVEP